MHILNVVVKIVYSLRMCRPMGTHQRWKGYRTPGVIYVLANTYVCIYICLYIYVMNMYLNIYTYIHT